MTLFRQMHDDEDAYYVTDGSAAAMADSLSRTSPPLLTLDLSAAASGYVLRRAVRLTETGRSMLAGRLDRVASCGIDRWLGGGHLRQGRALAVG